MVRRSWIFVLVLGACAMPSAPGPRVGDRMPRRGDEIVVCGQLFHSGTRVVLWTDPGGYDAAGTSARCFEILQDVRGLSAHFLLDSDGTIYQTLDVKERAWHAGQANDVSVGIEIANRGAYADRSQLGDAPLVEGTVHGVTLYQHPFTNEQYAALSRLCLTLARVLPRIRTEFPRDDAGRVVRAVLPDVGASFEGILGHSHVARGKVDPGPAFDWERLATAIKEIE